VRRWATSVTADDGFDLVELSYSDAGGFARWLVGYGSDVEVLEPPEVREAVVAHLRGMLAVQADRTTIGVN
jgi:proteasome accessory factor B